MDSGYPNAVTLLTWNRFYRKRISAGSSSTHTAYCSEHRARVAPFTLPAIHQRGRRLSPAIPKPVAKSGAHRKVIQAIRYTGNFIATSVSICQWNIWDRSRVEPDNSPASSTTESPTPAMRNNSMTERQPKIRQHNMQFSFWNNAMSRPAKSAKLVSIPSLSLRSMRNCSAIGGLKDQFSWNNSFDT